MRCGVAISVTVHQRLQLRSIGANIEVAADQHRRIVPGRRDERQQIVDLPRTYRAALDGVVQIRDVHGERPAIDAHADTAGVAVIVGRRQLRLLRRQRRIAGEDRIALTARAIRRIDREEPVAIAQPFGQRRGLIRQRGVLQHFLQQDHVGRQPLQFGDDQRLPVRPILLVVPEVQGDDGHWCGGTRIAMATRQQQDEQQDRDHRP